MQSNYFERPLTGRFPLPRPSQRYFHKALSLTAFQDHDGLVTDNDDELQFIAEDDEDPLQAASTPWLILIADDDVNVHETTKLALSGVKIHGRPLTFIHAYSGKEARQVLIENVDVNLILLDVVMETVDAGFKLVSTIRDELQRSAIRIILRTGQPGTDNQKFANAETAINGYTTKAQLTRSLLIEVLNDSLPEA